MQTLTDYLAARKAETLAWIAVDPSNRWASYPAQDLEHWAGYGITTVAQFERHEARATLYDFYKSVMGFRPHFNTDELTDEQVDAEMASLQSYAEFDRDQEALEAMTWQEHLAAYAEAHPDTGSSPFAILA